MGCGSSTASAPGKFVEDPELAADGKRIRVDKKTGNAMECDAGKDDDGREDDLFEVEEATGEQFMSIRPWIGQVAEPTEHNEVNNEKPETTYELEYVYGYRCADSRQNVYWNSQGQAVYMTAALGVVLDPSSNTQKFFGGGEVENTAKNVANDMKAHTDDVMCVSISPDRKTAVSGQVGSKPTIFTWDACTGEKKDRMKIAKGARGIAAVAINGEGWICAVDLHNEHQVYVFDNTGNLCWKQKGDTNKIHDIAWDGKPGSKRFSTAGVKHCYFWDASSANGDKKKGLFGSHTQTSFACTAWDDNGKCYTGGSNGEVYVWGGDDGRSCEKSMDAHKGFICGLRYINGKLWSGAKDGKVNCWNTNDMTVESSMQFEDPIRAIDVDASGCIIVGLRDGSIKSFDWSDEKTLMAGHSDGETWGLART